MSYEVFARKWRPLSFDDVVGQDHITRTLKKAVETGRIAHAYLFSGPRGCGKTSTARILARVINCENIEDGNPCNRCASCSAVIAGNNLDVMEIDGASHTGVAEVRELQESIGYTPSQSRNKVYIIDEVHMLSTHAFNALLKTLEEPPAHVFFIFATTAPHKIPDTIKSRCQRHHFKRLENAEIAGRLAHICIAEKVGFDDDGLRLLARKADGSMRDGTSLLDQCVTASGSNVTADAVRGILGLIDQEKVLGFIDAVAGGEPGAALTLLDAAINEGVDLQDLVSALLEGYRDLMLLAVPGDLSGLLFRSHSEIEHLRKSLSGYELADLVTAVERLSNASGRLRTMPDPRIFVESVLVDLSLLDRQTDIRALITRLESGGDGGNDEPRRGGAPKEVARPPGRSASALAPQAAAGAMETNPRRVTRAAAESDEESPDAASGAPPVPPEGNLDLAKIQQLWEGFVTFVRQKKVSLGVCLISGKPYSFEGGRLLVRFMKRFALQRDQVMRPEGTEFVGNMFHRYFGVSAEIVCFLEGEERAMKLEAALADQAPEARIRDVTEDKQPLVQQLIKDFDGEVVRYNT